MSASAGDMRHSVTVKNRTRTSDGAGGYANTGVSTDTLFCKVKQLSGKEAFQHGKLDGQGEWEFVCRKPSSAVVFLKSELEYDSKTFNVTSIIDTDERGKYLVIRATEGTAV